MKAYRISLWTFVAAVAAVAAFFAGIFIIDANTSGWDGLGAMVFLLFVLAPITCVLSLVSMISGFMAVKVRKRVLFWVIPEILLFLFSAVGLLSALDVLAP